ncbi:MAG: DnaJ domain-containing protein [Methylotenera sp.]|nr:DnaJ domain-containing protein [Methylotenera sp.]MDP3743162.1 DnaJ domain-containing protein [Methylotenera sp.]
MKDYYAILGVSANATLAEIKTTYRRMASQFHPDKNTSVDAPTKFRKVQEAYEVLSDIDKRKAFDENRRRSLLDSPIDTAHEIWQHYLNGILKK